MMMMRRRSPRRTAKTKITITLKEAIHRAHQRSVGYFYLFFFRINISEINDTTLKCEKKRIRKVVCQFVLFNRIIESPTRVLEKSQISDRSFCFY